MAKELWKGNEAIAEAAIRAGCDCFFGYPITPQNEIPEYMSLHMPQHGKVFVQAESEVAAINMVYGAAAAGKRAMTSSSSPGISLKQEGISYIAGAELPAVIINMSRGGPGLGTIQASQADYFQSTRGGGNGDYRTMVLAPQSIQEAVDLVQDAFDLADKYRNPVLILADGMIGQMMEPIEWKQRPSVELPPKDWAATGRHGREKNNFVTSLRIDAPDCELHNVHIQSKYDRMAEEELRYETIGCDGQEPEIILASYGTTARICWSAINRLERKYGIKAGLFRPITLFPFPYDQLHQIASRPGVKAVISVEMSQGQMVDDVKLAVNGAAPVHFFGRAGGSIPTVDEVADFAASVVKGGDGK